MTTFFKRPAFAILLLAVLGVGACTVPTETEVEMGQRLTYTLTDPGEAWARVYLRRDGEEEDIPGETAPTILPKGNPGKASQMIPVVSGVAIALLQQLGPGEIVENGHRMAIGRERLRDMGADETRTAGYQYLALFRHRPCLPRPGHTGGS